jgi:hypothetical protein
MVAMNHSPVNGDNCECRHNVDRISGEHHASCRYAAIAETAKQAAFAKPVFQPLPEHNKLPPKLKVHMLMLEDRKVRAMTYKEILKFNKQEPPSFGLPEFVAEDGVTYQVVTQ